MDNLGSLWMGRYLARVDEVSGGRGRVLLIPSAAAPTVDGVLQGAALGVRLWIVDLESHLLEQAFH